MSFLDFWGATETSFSVTAVCLQFSMTTAGPSSKTPLENIYTV